MNISPQSNSINFGAGYHVYFYTTDGKRIVSDANMKKCIHYMEAHLNGSKRVKTPNTDLIDTFKFGQVDKSTGKRIGGDYDYWNISKIRTVIDNTKDKVQGFMNIVTGKDVNVVNERYGKAIGKAKNVSIRRAGTTATFETRDAVGRYVENAPQYAEKKAVYKDGERRAFGIAFTPIYNKKGNLKGFEYHHSGFFNESAVEK